MPLRNMAETANDLYFTAISKLAVDCKDMIIASTQELCEQAQLAWMRFTGYDKTQLTIAFIPRI